MRLSQATEPAPTFRNFTLSLPRLSGVIQPHPASGSHPGNTRIRPARSVEASPAGAVVWVGGLRPHGLAGKVPGQVAGRCQGERKQAAVLTAGRQPAFGGAAARARQEAPGAPAPGWRRPKTSGGHDLGRQTLPRGHRAQNACPCEQRPAELLARLAATQRLTRA